MINRRVILRIQGDVQRVGYRDKVSRIASKEGITGEVRNLSDYDVEITAEGSGDALERFIQKIQIQQYPILVESIETREESWTGGYGSFKLIRGSPDEEMGERMDTAIQYLARIMVTGEKTCTNTELLLEKMDTSLGKQDQLLEKMDISLGKLDLIADLQHETLGEVKGLRTDITDTFDHRLTRIESQLDDMRTALAKAGITS